MYRSIIKAVAAAARGMGVRADEIGWYRILDNMVYSRLPNNRTACAYVSIMTFIPENCSMVARALTHQSN